MPKKSFTTSTPHLPQRRRALRDNLESNNYSDIMSPQRRPPSRSPTKRRSSRSPTTRRLSRSPLRRSKRNHRETDENDSSSSTDSVTPRTRSPKRLLDPNPEDSSPVRGLGTKQAAHLSPRRPRSRTRSRSRPRQSCSDYASDPQDDSSNMWLIVGMGVLVLCLCGGGIFFAVSTQELPLEEAPPDIEALKEKYPEQDDTLWLAFETGVSDVLLFNRPVSFFLVYTPESQPTLERLLSDVSKFAVCQLSDCSEEPIVLNETVMNSPEIVNDYGLALEKCKVELKQKAVMIVQDVDRVSAASAQVFHWLCDEYNPVVHKSLFIFTMKFEELPENKMECIEERLKETWCDLKPDSFNALITRILTVPLQVVPCDQDSCSELPSDTDT